MNIKGLNMLIPDTYVESIFNIKYELLHDNGIKYAVFDIDNTILPFDDVQVLMAHRLLFDYIKNDVGMETGLISNGKNSRVKPVGDILKINYVSNAKKPFGNFKLIKNMFDDKCNPENTMMIGDSFFLDMIYASKCGVYKVLVDPVKDGFNFKEQILTMVDYPFYVAAKKNGFERGKTFSKIK